MHKVIRASIDKMNVIILDYMNKDGINNSSAVRDLLTDVMHFCENQNIDFFERVQSAIDVFKEEQDMFNQKGVING
jgi:hypothetical protein